MKRVSMLLAPIAISGMLGAGVASAQAALKSPQSVKMSLRVMNQVVNHTRRLIAAKNYAIVPREQQELDAGAAMLREAIANEPAAFRSKIDPLIEGAIESSNAMGEAAKAHDDAKLSTTHDRFASAVRALVQQFPQDLRPTLGGTLGPGDKGPHGRRHGEHGGMAPGSAPGPASPTPNP